MIDGKGYNWTNYVSRIVVNMPNYKSTTGGTMVGNSGNGYARITLIKKLKDFITNITFDKGTLDTPFDPDTYEYDLFIDSDSVTTNISYTSDLDNYYITGVGEQTLNANTKHYVSIIDDEGNLALYVFNVLRKVPYLENLTFNEFEFQFDEKINTYDITVENNISEVTPNITAYSDTSYEILDPLSLHLGLNKIVIRVTDNLSGMTNDYVLNIIRKPEGEIAEHEATGLSSLSVSAGVLTPDFTSGTYAYDLQLTIDTEEIEISAIAEEEWSVVSGTGKYIVASGDSSYTISVLNYDGKIVNYLINVNRPTSSYKYLDGVKINGISYPEFRDNTFEYNIELDTGVDYIELDAIRRISGQEVSGEGKFPFVENEKTLTLLSKSEDGTQNQLYTFNFTRKKTSQLKSITTSFPMPFSSNKFLYELVIYNNVYSLDFNTETYFDGTMVTIEGNKFLDKEHNLVTITSHLDGVEDTVYQIRVKIAEEENTKLEDGIGYTGSPQEYIVPVSGYYKIELWGAGTHEEYDPNHKNHFLGAYTSGNIQLKKDEKLYFYVGQESVKFHNPATFNGGGKGGYATRSGYPGLAGSGATDVRLVNGPWNNFDSLKSRIMVAGGAGGPTRYYDGGAKGSAGGLVGYNGSYYAGHSYVYQNGYGGTQTSGGRAGANYTSGTGTTTASGFGFGGGANNTSTGPGAGGGGGGYYGGGAGGACQANGSGFGGGGGSSFISGHKGCNAITEDSTSSKIVHTGQPNHYSGKVFTDTVMIDGQGYKWTSAKGAYVGMPNYKSTTGATMVGNFGNGYAKITLLSTINSNNFLDSITLDDGAIPIDFDTGKDSYTIDLDETHKTIKINAIPKDKDATVVGLGTVKLAPGKNTHEISVTSTDGSTKIYSIVINRQGSNVPHPLDITIINNYAYLCELNEAYCNYTFAEATTNYDVFMPYDVNAITFNVKPRSEFQTIIYRKVVDGVATVITSPEVELNGGVNTFEIEVISEDETNNIVYTYNINRDTTGNNLLKSLTVTNPADITIDFDKYTYEYYITIPKDNDSFEVEAITEDDSGKATVDIKGNTNLKPGMNDCIITVTAENKETRTYIIHAYSEINRSTMLTDLKIFNGSEELQLEPTFSSMLKDYTLNVPNEVSKINIVATKEDTTATIVGDGNQNLNTGVNTLNVSVTATNGDVNIYKIVVNRAKSNNANLKSLSVENHSLNLEFNKDTLEYEVNIDRSVTSLNILAETESSAATYTVRGNNNLSKNINEIVITVTAENKDYKIYKIKAIKEMSNNNYLSSLKVMNGTEELALDTLFDKTDNEYHITVGGNVSNVDIIATSEDSAAVISGNGKQYLVTGDNEFEVKVTSELGQENIYKVIVTKELNNDLTLKEVKNNQNSEVEKIEDVTLGYDYLINVQYEVNSIEITGVLNASESTIVGNGNYKLDTGNNDITLTVTSEAGNSKDYIVRVVRDKNNNDDLNFLYVEEGGLDPHFSETIILYDVKVPNNTKTLHIEAKPEDKNATYEVVGGVKQENNTYTYDISSFELNKPQFIEVVVNAENGIDKKTYTLSVTKQGDKQESENISLEELKTNRGDFTTTFNPDVLNYELTVENDISDITVSATAFSEDVEVMGTGTYDLKVGKNVISVFVIGKSGVQRDYQIVVTRKKSNDATLSNLVIKSHTLNPNFSKDTINYDITTSASTLEFTTIKPTHNEATYKIGVIDSENNFSALPEIGVNKIDMSSFLNAQEIVIRVTASDNETYKDYKITINKEPSKNNNLANLEVEGYTLVPTFHKGLTFYAINVENNINSIVIKAQAEDTTASITGVGRKVVNTGENYFDIVVTSAANTAKTYKILITKDASDNNYLAELTTSEGELDSNFDKLKTDYTINVANNIDTIELAGKSEDVNATVNGFGTYSLTVGDNNIPIVVTSESGVIRTYNIKVIREDIISAYLTNLEVQSYDLDSEFNKEVFEYYLNVDNEITSLDLTYTLEDNNANVVVSGNENFVVGMNEVLIKVTREIPDKEPLEQIYKLYVNRAMSTNNYLKTLSLDKGTISFNPNTLEYTVDVASDVDVIHVYATTMDSSAVITSKIGDSNPYSLEKGMNKILVKVRSSIGVTRTYTLNINRQKSANNYLSSLEVYAGEDKVKQELNFVKETLNYEINLTSSYDSVEIKATKEDDLATVIGDGVILLNSGENNFSVIVTAEDGSVKTYTLKINNLASDNNYLTNLVPSTGTLDPEFNKETLSYTLNLGNEVTNLSFEATLENSKASVTGNEVKGIPEGESTREIVVTAENGDKKTYTITIHKESASEARLASLTVDGYTFTFNPDTFSYNLQVSDSKEKLLASEITVTPKDSAATVNLMGDLDLVNGMINIYTIEVIAKDGYTTQTYTLNVTRDSADYTLNSNVYEIVRNEDFDYVIGILPNTKISDFKLNFQNEQKMLNVYTEDGTKIADLDTPSVTGMIIKLESTEHVYDELRIIVRGDLTKDGKVNGADQVKLINYVGKATSLDHYQMLAADLTKDGKVNGSDQVKLINYVGKAITEIN